MANEKVLGTEGVKTLIRHINAKAPIADPELTGVPKVPTAAAGTSTTQAASTEFVMDALAVAMEDVKGDVDTYNDLPTAASDPAPEVGDIWHVKEDTVGTGTDEDPEFPAGYYKWNGTEWEKIEISTSTELEYFTAEEIDAMFAEVAAESGSGDDTSGDDTP